MKKRVVLRGRKGEFVPSALAMSKEIKKFKYLFSHKFPATEMKAFGWHAENFDLIVFKGSQNTRLVAKKYKLQNFPEGETQSAIAEKEFEAFQALKKAGYHTPPTIRLVEMKGEKYLALSDLTKFGDMQTDDFEVVKKFTNRELKDIKKYVKKENQKAEKELGLYLKDSWEYVINSKTKTVWAFIIDVSLNFDKDSTQWRQ